MFAISTIDIIAKSVLKRCGRISLESPQKDRSTGRRQFSKESSANARFLSQRSLSQQHHHPLLYRKSNVFFLPHEFSCLRGF